MAAKDGGFLVRREAATAFLRSHGDDLLAPYLGAGWCHVSTESKQAWFENVDGGTWTQTTLTSSFVLPQAAIPTDLDADGDLDVVCGASGAFTVFIDTLLP